MNSIGFNRFCRALILLAALLEFSANAQSIILTNDAPKAIPRRASIILIVADGLGYGDLSCYGQTKFQTPNIDKLASEGIRFTNYFVAGEAPKSHSMLLDGHRLVMDEDFVPTGAPRKKVDGKDLGAFFEKAEKEFEAGSSVSAGMNQSQSNLVVDNDIVVAANRTTVAEVLKNSGYHTGLIGEWYLGDENSGGAPWRKGFDEFAGYLDPAGANNFYADYMFRYAPKSIFNETNSQMDAFIGREMIYANIAGQKGQYIPDLYTHAALQFIKNNQPDGANHYQPFFLLLNYPVPKTGMPVPTDAPFSDEPWPQPEKNQAALILRLDGYIGQLQEQLQKIGMTNNAVILFTSSSVAQKAGGVDPQFFHSNLSTNDLRVPMIVHWPGKIPAGQVSGFAWSPQDFLPTAAEIASTKPPEKIDGNSVLPALTGQTQTNSPVEK